MPILSASRALRLSHTGDIQRIPAGTNPDARETVASDVACSAVYPASTEQAERAGMATTTRLMVAYIGVATVQEDWRFLTGGIDYRIRAISRWPRGGAHFMELLLEEEG
jgi:hypothetical protein